MATMSLALLLAAAALLCGLALPLGQRLGRRTGWITSGGLIALTVWLVVLWTGRSGSSLQGSWSWLPSIGVSFRLRLDGLSLVFALVVLVIGALVMAYAVNYLPRGRHGVFYALLTFFAVAMLGLVMADDLVLLWVMWEFTTLCSFLLIQQSGPKGTEPAVRTLLVTAGGGLCLLAAIALTITQTGTTTLSAALASPIWHERPGLAAVVATLVAVAAFTKSAQFPFHGWLPDAMVASTPVSAYLHAAAMVKAAMYLLLRFSTAFHSVPIWNVLLVSVGLLTTVLGAVYALQRFDLKELLAYSTISQLGLIVATIGIGTGYAVTAAILHVIAHAVFKSSLFMGVGLIDHETDTRDLRKLSGLRRTMPWTTACMALAAASMAGIPPLFGFVSKEAMFKAMTHAHFASGTTVLVCVVAVVGAMCTVAYSARMLRPAFGGPMDKQPHEAPGAMLAPVLITAGAGIVLGVAGPVLATLVDDGARSVLPSAADADLGLWHGLSPALLMSVIALGAGLVVARHTVDRVLIGRRLGIGTAVGAVEGFRSGSIALGRKVGDVTRSDTPFRQLLAPLAVLVIATGAVLAGGAPRPRLASNKLDWLLLALVIFGALITLRARNRVSLVTTVGVVGFSTALLFYTLGAPDVAITQLVVEILTVVVMVLLLVRLPGEFHHTGPRRSRVAVVVALLSAGAAFVVALFVLTPTGVSRTGDDYLRRAYELTGGTNIVNTILVDFRAFDTLGEMVVLGTAAVAIVVALESRGMLPLQPNPFVVDKRNPIVDPHPNTVAIRVIDRVIGPILVALSLWLFLRGHYQTGGGFIGSLVAGAAVVLVFLAAGDDWVARLRIPHLQLVGLGMVIAAGTGLLGLFHGSFLRPMYADVLGLHLSTGLIFDVGVYLTVLGLIMGALARFGLDSPDHTPLRNPGRVTTREPGER